MKMITIEAVSRLKVETSLVTALNPHLPRSSLSPASTPPPPLSPASNTPVLV